jgi:amino acid permease
MLQLKEWCSRRLPQFFNGYSLFLADSWDTSSFIVSYIALPVFIGCTYCSLKLVSLGVLWIPVCLLTLSLWVFEVFLFWKFFKKTKIVRLAEMDFGELLGLSLPRWGT